MTVVYVCDDAFWEQTLCSMASVINHNPKKNIRLVLIDQGITAEHKECISTRIKGKGTKVSFLPAIPLQERLGLKYENYHTSSIFAKLLFPELFTEDLVLYLDSDTIVCEDLSPLFQIDMTESLAAGVAMTYCAETKEQAGISGADPYISDGVVLLNLKLWREQGITEDCLRFIRENNGSPFMLSEGTINHACRGRIKALPLSCNVMSSVLLYKKEELEALMGVKGYYTEEEYAIAKTKPVILHFLNELYVRPWYANSDHPYRDAYRAVLRELSLPSPSEQKKLPKRTRINRLLYRCLPFSLYLKINQRAR